jgi:hypothetical protein
MPRQNWDATTKAKIVLQGLQGKPVAATCATPRPSRTSAALLS